MLSEKMTLSVDGRARIVSNSNNLPIVTTNPTAHMMYFFNRQEYKTKENEEVCVVYVVINHKQQQTQIVPNMASNLNNIMAAVGDQIYSFLPIGSLLCGSKSPMLVNTIFHDGVYQCLNLYASHHVHICVECCKLLRWSF